MIQVKHSLHKTKQNYSEHKIKTRVLKVFLMPCVCRMTQLCDTNVAISYRTPKFITNQPVRTNSVDTNYVIACLMHTQMLTLSQVNVNDLFIQITEIINSGIYLKI